MSEIVFCIDNTHAKAGTKSEKSRIDALLYTDGRDAPAGKDKDAEGDVDANDNGQGFVAVEV